MLKPRFEFGELVITANAQETLGAIGLAQVPHILARHRACDWGDVPREDADRNNAAIAHEGDPDQMERVVSSYHVGKQQVWIITEADRSVTTILLPEDY